MHFITLRICIVSVIYIDLPPHNFCISVICILLPFPYAFNVSVIFYWSSPSQFLYLCDLHFNYASPISFNVSVIYTVITEICILINPTLFIYSFCNLNCHYSNLHFNYLSPIHLFGVCVNFCNFISFHFNYPFPVHLFGVCVNFCFYSPMSHRVFITLFVHFFVICILITPPSSFYILFI